VHLFVCLWVFLYTWLSLCLSVCFSVRLRVCLPFRLSDYLSSHLLGSLSLCLCISHGHLRIPSPLRFTLSFILNLELPYVRSNIARCHCGCVLPFVSQCVCLYVLLFDCFSVSANPRFFHFSATVQSIYCTQLSILSCSSSCLSLSVFLSVYLLLVLCVCMCASTCHVVSSNRVSSCLCVFCLVWSASLSVRMLPCICSRIFLCVRL